MDVFNCLKGSWCISRCRGDTVSPGFTLGNQLFGYYVAKTLTDGAFAKILFARILAQGKSYVRNQISWKKGGSPDRDGPPHSKGPCSNIFIWIVWDSSTHCSAQFLQFIWHCFYVTTPSYASSTATDYFKLQTKHLLILLIVYKRLPHWTFPRTIWSILWQEPPESLWDSIFLQPGC